MKSIADMLKEYTPSSEGKLTLPLATPTPKTTCSICQGTGYLRRDVPLGHPDFGKPIPCQCRQNDIVVKKQDELRKISNLDALANLTFANFRTQAFNIPNHRLQTVQMAYNAALQYAENPIGWFILQGGYGCGKTHLASAIANHVASEGKSVIFVVVPDLLDHLRSAFNPENPTSYDERFELIRTAPLLILDDFGSHSSTQWAQEKLFQILNYRYNSRLATVITTNLEPEVIDGRMRSRMWDPNISQCHKIRSFDYRQSRSQEHSDLSTLSLHEDKRFDNFDLRHGELKTDLVLNLKFVLEQSYNYAINPAGWFVLSGSYGCGKTHLAAAIAHEYFHRSERLESALFVTVPDLLDYLRAAFSPNSTSTYDRRFEEVRKTPFLVLDDLGTESATAWASEKLYQLFSYRYNAHLPTVVTIGSENNNLSPRLKAILMRNRIYFIKAPPYTANYHQNNDLVAPPPNLTDKFTAKELPSHRRNPPRRPTPS